MSLSEQLLEEALLLGLVVLGALGSGALLGGRSSDGALVQVGITANKVHCALDVRKYLDLLHLQKHGNKARGNAYRGKEVARTITDSVGKSLKAVNHFDRFAKFDARAVLLLIHYFALFIMPFVEATRCFFVII